MSFLSEFKKLYKPIKTIPWTYGVYFFGQAFDGFQSIFGSQIAAYLISSIENKSEQQLMYWIGGFVIFYVIWVALNWIENIFHTKSLFAVQNHLYDAYLTKYVNADNTKVEKLGTGKSINIINKWISDRSDLLVDGFTWFVVEILTVFYALTVVFFQIPLSYFMILLFLVLLMLLIMIRSASVSKKTRKQSIEVENEIERQKVKIIMSKFEIQQQDKIRQELDTFWNQYTKNRNLRIRNNHIVSWINSLNDAIILGIKIAMYGIIGMGVIKWEYGLSTLVLLIGIFETITHYLWNIRGYITGFARRMTTIEKLLQTEEDIKPVKEKKIAKKYKNQNGDIMLDKISFAYDKNKLFSDFSLHIIGWQRTAFVWPSGSGKTTLIKLLGGYISPDKWQIIVDWQKLSQINIQSYYAHVGYLTQDPSVFDGTIRDNLMYGVQDPDNITEAEVKKVLAGAKCDFIWDFENWRDTEIWERGIRLSGGQKQRLAIAKIMLKNPKIVFLDEPTSAMDSFNEEEVVQALHNLFEWRTVVVVAHRLQTVKQADKIYYLEASDHGAQIIEEWTHNELVKKNGKYKKMLDLQSWF